MFEGEVTVESTTAPMRMAIANKHGKPYSFRRIVISDVPLDCDKGERDLNFDLAFPPPGQLGHPLIGRRGQFDTRINDVSGSRLWLTGRVGETSIQGKLKFHDTDDKHGLCRTPGRLEWLLHLSPKTGSDPPA